MRIVCTGSRHWTNRDQLYEIMDEYLNQFLDDAPYGHMQVAHGKSKGGGADLLVADWCWDRKHAVDEWPFPVMPDLDGRHKGAPLKRNERMVASFIPDLVVGFRSIGKSNGTDHTIHYARRMGFPAEVHDES